MHIDEMDPEDLQILRDALVTSLCHWGLCWDDAEDVAQEALLKWLLAGDLGFPRAWLRQVAHQTAFDAERTRRRRLSALGRPLPLDGCPASDPELPALERMKRQEVLEAAYRAADSTEDIILTAFLHGETYRATAARLGKPAYWVGRRFDRIVTRVREAFGETPAGETAKPAPRRAFTTQVAPLRR